MLTKLSTQLSIAFKYGPHCNFALQDAADVNADVYADLRGSASQASSSQSSEEEEVQQQAEVVEPEEMTRCAAAFQEPEEEEEEEDEEDTDSSSDDTAFEAWDGKQATHKCSAASRMFIFLQTSCGSQISILLPVSPLSHSALQWLLRSGFARYARTSDVLPARCAYLLLCLASNCEPQDTYLA